MFYLLQWRLWLALALAGGLAFTHVYVYRTGAKHVRLEWTAATAAANIEAFKTSEIRQRNTDSARNAAAARAIDDRNRAAGVADALDKLRSTLDAAERHAAQSSNAAAKYAAALRADLESCSKEYRSVGEEAAGHARDSLMYQQSWPK